MCPIHIEYIPNADPLNNKYGIILLYGDDPGTMTRLRDQVASLAAKQVKRVAVHEIPGFESIADCRLFLSVARWDAGTYSLQGKNEFECELDPIGWEDIFGLLEPAVEPTGLSGFI